MDGRRRATSNNPRAARLIVGAMSGTSADGVDIAITRITGRGLSMKAALLLHHARAYSPALRRRIFALRGRAEGSLKELAALGRDIALAYATAVQESLTAAKLKPGRIAAIAAHGQTFFHAPPLTIQWLDPALLARETGCPVISDFRRADCAAGGQGAPLVPFADYILFRHRSRGRILLNIGGIANLTCLPPSARFDQITAFDTGPGNCVSDRLMRQHRSAGVGYDAGGRLALDGLVDQCLLTRLMSDSYFSRPHPKSTDGPAMIAAWTNRMNDSARPNPARLADALATACAWTAESIARGIRRAVGRGNSPHEIILSGGGSDNAAIVRELRQRLPGIPLFRSDDLGVPSQAKEALAFALLGAATLDDFPANVPGVTGASRGVVLGSITPRP